MIKPSVFQKKILKFFGLFLVICNFFIQNICASKDEEKVGYSASSSTVLSLLKEVTPYDFGESVSFSSSGLHFPYHLGVASFLQDHYNLEKVRFLGASGGVCAALMLGMELDFQKVWGDCEPKLHEEIGKKLTGPLFNFEDIATKVFLDYLPEEIYKKANKKVLLAITFFWLGIIPYNEYISEWSSNKEIAETVVASTKIPYFTKRSFFARYKGRKCIDGALTKHQPVLDSQTILVCPYTWGNLWRIGGLVPVFNKEYSTALIKKGYQDAQSHSDHWVRLDRYKRETPLKRTAFAVK